VAVLVVTISHLMSGAVCGDENTADPYDTLYDVLMTRHGKDGKTYALDETGPPIFVLSNFPFGDRTYKKFHAALDAFAALPQSKIEAYSEIKRALLQRHLWKVFDATFPHNWQVQLGRTQSLPERRAAVRPKIASLIRRLALTQQQILAIPNTIVATAESGDFNQSYDPTDQFKPFLPADLYANESSWVSFVDERGPLPGEDRSPLPAFRHSRKLKMRSAFLQFIRVPGGRRETLKFLEDYNDSKRAFPVGTQFAFIEQALLIRSDGQLAPSPLIVSISLRAYLDVERSAREARPQPTQCVAEFVMQPRQLIQGNAVMKALGPRDRRYEAGDSGDIRGGVFDPFETGEIPHLTRLERCMTCHGRPGLRSVLTISGPSTALINDTPAAVINETIARKREDKTWKALQELWRGDSKQRLTQTPARADQSQPRLEGKRKPEELRIAAAASNTSFDALYNVLMVRHARNGVAFGEHEVSPMIFKFSDFPFDDTTFPRLKAAIDGLSTSDIKSLSNVERAILQRLLWAVFDATTPSRFLTRRSHQNRRQAVHQRLAGLIRQLALTKSEIKELPSTLLATVQSRMHPDEFNLDDPLSPFLPPELIEQSSTWICFGRSSSPVTFHAERNRWRSAFFQFIRLPAGRDATAHYIDHWNGRVVFPVGTQVALIEKAFLISDHGQIVLSPITVSVQLRAYRNVEQSQRDAESATQCVAEFISRPRDYMRGNSLMTALYSADYRIKALASGGGKQDVFELVSNPNESLQPRLSQCVNCHGGAGTSSLGDVIVPRGTLKSLQQRTPAEIAEKTAEAKQTDSSWELLRDAWN